MAVEDLGVLVGAEFWETGRCERALGLAGSDGLVHTTANGLVSAAG